MHTLNLKPTHNVVKSYYSEIRKFHLLEKQDEGAVSPAFASLLRHCARQYMIENDDVLLNWRVEKMKLSKDNTQIIYNDFLTLGGIPPEAFEYRLGNRSALDWIIDQYRVKIDKPFNKAQDRLRGITNDLLRLRSVQARADDPEYIVRLIKQVVTVSVETVKIVKGLPELEKTQREQ